MHYIERYYFGCNMIKFETGYPVRCEILRVLLIAAILVLIPVPGEAGSERYLHRHGFETVARNDHLRLLFDAETFEFAVEVLSSGWTWYSNPQTRENDAIANEHHLNRLRSQIEVEFYSPTDQRMVFTSYQHGVLQRAVRYETIPYGVRVTYVLTNRVRGIEEIPRLIDAAHFSEVFLPRMTSSEQVEFFERFRLDGDGSVFVRRVIPAFAVPRILSILDSIGYGSIDLERDRQLETERNDRLDRPQRPVEADSLLWLPAAREQPFVTISVPVEYVLDDADLLVRVVANEITATENYTVHSISLIPFFGSGGSDQAGYMLVPDGSGAVIHLNNGRTRHFPYRQRVYGNHVQEPLRERILVQQPVLAPFFGMVADGRAWFAVVEDGDEVTVVEADTGGRVTEFNHVNARFVVREKGTVSIGSGARTQSKVVFESEPLDRTIQLRYVFLSGESADYVGMAHWYRTYLQRRGALPMTAKPNRSSFHLLLKGAVDVPTTFIGFRSQRVVPTTSIPAVVEIATRLQRAGIDPVVIRYTGVTSGGIRNSYVGRPEIEQALGSPVQMRALSDSLASMGILLAFDLSVLEAHRSGNGFTPRNDARRYLDQSIARSFSFDWATFQRDATQPYAYAVSPRNLELVGNRLRPFLHHVGVPGVSFSDIGRSLDGDYRRSRPVPRFESMAMTSHFLRTFAEATSFVAVAGGNAYTWASADHVYDLPHQSSQFLVTDRSVPFIPFVLRDLVRYSHGAINLSADYRDVFLRSVESGADLAFTWIDDISQANHSIAARQLFSTSVDAWLPRASELFREHSETMDAIRNARLVSHRLIEPGVYESRYDNGVSLLVNYNRRTVLAADVFLPPQGYLVVWDRTREHE